MKKLSYDSFAKEIDGANYCTEVVTMAENMIEGEENDAKICFPTSKDFIHFRSKEYRITTDTLWMMLPYPIYKIVSIKMKPVGMKLGGGKYDYTLWVDENGNPFVPDVTRFFVTNEEYKALPERPSDLHSAGVYGWERARTNTLTYERNASDIYISPTRKRAGPTSPEIPQYMIMMLSAFYNKEETQKYYAPEGVGYTQNLYEMITQTGTLGATDLDPRQWEYQIAYIPVSQKTKLKFHKI